jgi:uncharacterized membrane protein YgaE (UPF0421/DUF939 family)
VSHRAVRVKRLPRLRPGSLFDLADSRRSRLNPRVPPPPRPRQAELQLVAKMVVAGTLAWWISTKLGADRPLFAVLVPLVAMSGDPFAAFNVSVARTIGVFAGVFLGLGIEQLDLPSTALVALLLALSLGAGLLLRSPHGPVNNQVAITAMFMLYLGASPRATTVGVDRIWETAIGAGCAVAVAALLWPPDPLAEASRRVARLRGWLDEDIERAAVLLVEPDAVAAEEQLDRVRERSLQAVRDVFELDRGERALRWNPLRRGDRAAFAQEDDRLNGAARQYRHLRTITRIVADLADSQPPPEEERRRLARTMRALDAAVADSLIVPPPVELGELHDPRSIGLAVKLRQMVDDLDVPHS